MTEQYDASYYLRREETARDLARRSADPTISRIHAEMADRYAELARQAPPAMIPNVPGRRV